MTVMIGEHIMKTTIRLRRTIAALTVVGGGLAVGIADALPAEAATIAFRTERSSSITGRRWVTDWYVGGTGDVAAFCRERGYDVGSTEGGYYKCTFELEPA